MPEQEAASERSPRRSAVPAGAGLGLLIGVLAAIGWHVQPPPRTAIFHIFGVPSRVSTPTPDAAQIALWTDPWRPLWWPAAAGCPLAGLVIGGVAGLATRWPLLGRGVARRPVAWFGALGLVLGTLGAVCFHYYPYRLHEPTPVFYAPGNQVSPADRDQLLASIRASGFGSAVSDWAPPWWPAIVAYVVGGLVLGFLAGLVLRRRTTQTGTAIPPSHG